MVEAGRRGEVGGPDLGGVADGDRGAARRGRPAGARRRPARASNRARSAARRSGSRAARPAERSRIAAAPPAGSRNSDAGSRTADSTVPTVRWSVGSNDAQRIDLVAEELDPDRQRHRRREDVDDAAAPRELAAAGDLGDRHVAEVEQLAQERVLVEPGAEPELARRGRQVRRGDRVLEQRLDARDEDPGPAAPPRGERGDPGGRLVGDELAALVGERRPRLEDGDRRRIAEPGAELLGDPVADLRVAGDPDEPLAVGASARAAAR